MGSEGGLCTGEEAEEAGRADGAAAPGFELEKPGDRQPLATPTPAQRPLQPTRAHRRTVLGLGKSSVINRPC